MDVTHAIVDGEMMNENEKKINKIQSEIHKINKKIINIAFVKKKYEHFSCFEKKLINEKRKLFLELVKLKKITKE